MPTVLASTFWPDHFWIVVVGYLMTCLLLTIAAFVLTSRFDGSWGWVMVAMISGGIAAGAASCIFFPAGVAAGALLGGLLSIVLARYC